MRKEVLLAVIFGIILGGVILYGINLANKSVSNGTATQNTTGSKPTPTPSNTVKSLEIMKPVDHTVTIEKTINLEGKATPGSTLAIVSESDDLIIEASTEGTFSAKLSLVSGENVITVTQLLKDNKTVTETLTVIQTATLPE